MLQLPFASKHISEDDDDDWHELLHLALINEPRMSPPTFTIGLGLTHARQSVTSPSFPPPSPSTPPSPLCLQPQTDRPVATRVTASRRQSQCLMSPFLHCRLKRQGREIKSVKSSSCKKAISTHQYWKILLFNRLLTIVITKSIQPTGWPSIGLGSRYSAFGGLLESLLLSVCEIVKKAAKRRSGL